MPKLVTSNDPVTRLRAEQAVAVMNNRLPHKLTARARDGLTEALTQAAGAQSLVFSEHPFIPPPPRWSLAGQLARLIVILRPRVSDKAMALRAAYAMIKRNSLAGLLGCLLFALFAGVVELGKPAEIATQSVRDGLRPTTASGDIVIVTKDEASAPRYGGLIWQRRYDAQLVDRLRMMGVQRIVFHEAMDQASNRTDDDALEAALARAKGKVWLDAAGADARTRPDGAFADAGQALARLLAAGADRGDIGAVARVAAYEAVFSLLYMLGDPGVDGGEAALLHESLLSADPSGREGRPAPDAEPGAAADGGA